MADKYGIPAGGDAYPGKVRYFHDNKRTLTARELLAVMKEAGWPEGSRTLAAAVALAESNGCPFVYNTYKKGHFGLFQISRSAWPEFFEGGSDQWADPVANAKKALEIKNSSGWKAWEGYTNDRWTKYKNEVAAAALEESRGRPFGPACSATSKRRACPRSSAARSTRSAMRPRAWRRTPPMRSVWTSSPMCGSS